MIQIQEYEPSAVNQYNACCVHTVKRCFPIQCKNIAISSKSSYTTHPYKYLHETVCSIHIDL